MHQVMIQSASYADVRSAVDRVFEQFPLDLSEKRVLIKPNALRSSEPAEGIVTHPALVRAVVEKVETLHPAAIVVGDNPGAVSYGTNEAVFDQTGLADAACGYYRNIGLDAVPVPFLREYVETVSVSRAILEADIIISLPKFKTHGLTVLSGAIKNSYGILPGAQKARLHKIAGSPARFHDLVVEIFKLRIPDLFIVDAILGMQGNGPASTDLREIGLLLAGDNGVAVDAVIAALMGIAEPGKLGFLRKAAADGLGSWHPEDIHVEGALVPIKNFVLPPLGGEASENNAALQAMLDSRTRLVPRADPNGCTGCGTCVEQCPAEALVMVDGLPEADMSRCVMCFCCQEMCPEKAMQLL